ncbi:MAG: 5-oxoprolinase subunit PxpB [Xanthomonadales bacterium]|nr:5-oxoprolinase subunit PxpB [Xanthomonadales bacterium]
MKPSIKPIADCAVLVEFENRIAEDVNDEVLALLAAIDAARIPAVIEAVPAYRSLMVYYDPVRIGYDEMAEVLNELTTSPASQPAGRRWRVPVWYGGPAAKDLGEVAKRHGLSEKDVIRIHSETTYRVYLVGFAPGWTFLGGLDERLHTPRLDTPRAEVPAGAISIAGQQGLICGPAMPSGWNLLGQTPERTWAPGREEPFFIEPGDAVEFRRIDEKEYQALAKRAATGERVSEAL